MEETRHRFNWEDPQFQKLYQFERTHEWKLPQTVYTADHFQIDEFQEMKRQLNLVKAQLGQFNLTEWSLHTQNRDVAGYVISQLKKKVGPELLTQAWCKFFEIVCTFPLIQQENNYIKSLHLCEAPGAFVCALNHYLVSRYPKIHWQWQANTLNPDYEGNPPSHMISDDRLICHTRDSWLFGVDLTGDIQQFYNHVDIVNQSASEEKINLVTADGSIDCMSDPGEQEKLVQFLHYCETMTALAVLNKGGSFVLKIFTIFEESTICLLYLLNCVFEKVFLFKPGTSKSGNSELYLICLRYNGLDVLSFIWDTLIDPYRNGFFNNNVSMFSLNDIPNSFKVQLKSCCSYFFVEKQIETIENNIYYYLNPDSGEDEFLRQRKSYIANCFIKKYKVKKIPQKCKIVPYLKVHFRHKSWHNFIESQAISMNDWCADNFLEITLGKRIDMVYTSRFALVEYIKNLSKKLNCDQLPPTLYNSVLSILNTTTTVINGKSFNLIPYHRFQKDLFWAVSAAINSGKHIIFLNVPFHTYFLAGLWAITASSFENVYFDQGWCLFHKPVGSKITIAKNMFLLIENAYNNIDHTRFICDIIYLFQPKVFFNDISFIHKVLSFYNNFLVPS